MRRKMKKHLASILAFALVVSSLLGSSSILTVNADTSTDSATIALTQDDVNRLNGSTVLNRIAVHDPSITVNSDGTYYIFGSHMGTAKSSDLQNWTKVANENDAGSSLFGDVSSGNAVSYEYAFVTNGDAGKLVTVTGKDGNPYQVSLGCYDIASWIASDGHTVQGNMWAPDIIFNPIMGKWCMYLSLNGEKWNSAVLLLTSDNIEGPYVYQAPIVFSGFSTTDSSKSFKNTDLEIVIGEQAELPAKYQKIADGSWGEYWPHAIDPAVFYDDNGKLWLTYGSWSGGIYMLELDENTGLRDYTVTYASDFDTKGKSVTTDEYFGKKIAGGYYVSGEGPYIEKIGNYYYLFMSYGFYDPNGGYVMRVFRSENPDGPYVDGSGNSAIFTKYLHNYNGVNNMGMKLMGNYKWNTMTKGEVAQGHNSAIVASDGKAYLVYHTKFDDSTYTHEVRTHQLFVNEDGWLVAAPYEYAGETISSTGYEADVVVGEYELIIHDYKIDYADLATKTSETISLNADGTINGAYEGTWSATNGTPNVTLVIGGETYKGVFTEQKVTGSNITVMAFTATSTAGVSVWGSGQPTDDVAVAQTAADNSIVIPQKTYGNITLPTEGLSGASISWNSSNTAVLANDGTVTAPEADTDVTLVKRIYKGDYYFETTYTVKVMAAVDGTVANAVGTYFTNDPQDLSQHIDASLSVPNPFYKGTTGGLDISGGVTIEFDAEATGAVHALGTIFSFMGNNGTNGRFYFTPGSYLGYNATGGYFDANMKDFGLVTDYIGTAAHVKIEITSKGFTVTINDEVAYTEEIVAAGTAGSGNLANYGNVLTWLQESADTLYFGYGSFWNAVGYDEANIKLSNVVCSVNPTVATDSVEYTKDEVVLATNSDLTIEENPFYGKNIDNAKIEYTINMTEGTPQLGWDGIFSFFNSATNGRISIQTAPYLCYNNALAEELNSWMDVNQPGAGGDNLAPSMTPGTEHTVSIVITKEALEMTVDGTKINIIKNGSGANYEELLMYLTQCDQLTWGVGLAQTAYWNTELCTLTNISFTSEGNGAVVEPEVPANPNPMITADEIVLSADDAITYINNPFKNADFDALSVDYTINFAENAALNGWDSIFSFYNSATTGRVSFQVAPYVCYNDVAGKWIDINQPANDTCSINDYGLVAGEDYDVNILITKDEVSMYLNGVQIPITENGSGADYEDLLEFISTCDQFTWGVGNATTAYWNNEICTLKNMKICKHEPAMVATENTFTLATNDAIEIVANPYYGQDVEELYVEYTINFAESAAKNGWDGIFSFYDTTSTGRISFQTAPYVCYNDWAGNWIDINNPNLGGENIAASAQKGTDITFSIYITKDDVVMTANGEEIAFEENGSGATYEDLISFISKCDQLTYGVGQAVTSLWWTEMCTVSDLVIAPVSINTAVDGEGTVTGAVHKNVTTLTATAEEGSEFTGWYAGNILIGTEATVDVTACKTVEIKAVFEALATPTPEPTAEPTPEPTAEPTEAPTEEPTAEPTEEPTEEPTAAPTEAPTEEPTAEPTTAPTAEPVDEFMADISEEMPTEVLTSEVMNATGCDTVEKLVIYLQTVITESDEVEAKLPGFEESNTKVIDITVKTRSSEDEPWVVVTPENFPEDGIDVLIPYPNGTNASEYDFVIGHMFTSGSKAGQMEYPEVVETAEGLKIHITSASPFVVAWTSTVVEVPTAAPTAAPTAEPTVAPTEAPTAEPTVAPTTAPTTAPTAAPVVAPVVTPVEPTTSGTSPKTYDDSVWVDKSLMPEKIEDVQNPLDYPTVAIGAQTAVEVMENNNNTMLYVIGLLGLAFVVIGVTTYVRLRKGDKEEF